MKITSHENIEVFCIFLQSGNYALTVLFDKGTVLISS